MTMPFDSPLYPTIVIVAFIAITQIFAWTRDDTIIEKFKPTERDIAVTAAFTLDILFASIITVIWIW